MEKWATRSRVHLVLAHLLQDNPEYWNFYATRINIGETVILDNGAYEKGMALDSDEYGMLISAFHPTVAVLPDLLMQRAQLTVSASLRFLDRWGQLPVEWMFVPQSTPDDLPNWYAALNTTLADMRVGHLITWCGLPRALHTHFGGVRVRVAAVIKTLYPSLKLHALGMGNASIAEYNDLKPLCESIDSSCAVWRGWNGYRLDDAWPDFAFDINAKDLGNDKVIEYNLNLLGYGA
jgi:hypothetical protein